MIDRCYRTGRYWQLDYHSNLMPELPEDEEKWVDQLLVDAGLLS